MAKRSGKRQAVTKPSWPHAHITKMTAHPNGQWCKKIKGEVRYFGPWDDPDLALRCWLAEQTGERVAPVDADIVTVRKLTSDYIRSQADRVEHGTLAPYTFQAMQDVARLLRKAAGADTPVDRLDRTVWNDLSKLLGEGTGTRDVQIRRVRRIFTWGRDEGLVRRVPSPQDLHAPTKADVRRDKRRRARSRGGRVRTPTEIIAVLAASSTWTLRAMILLGINAGFGPSDCSELDLPAVDLERGVIDFERSKTGIERQAVLWPETKLAMSNAWEERKAPADDEDADRFFLTTTGRRWIRDVVHHTEDGRIAKVSHSDSLGGRFRQIVNALGLSFNFYDLRHTYRTIADNAGDQHAAYRIMGHQLPGMADAYVGEVSLDRIKAVTDHVRWWLYRRR